MVEAITFGNTVVKDSADKIKTHRLWENFFKMEKTEPNGAHNSKTNNKEFIANPSDEVSFDHLFSEYILNQNSTSPIF